MAETFKPHGQVKLLHHADMPTFYSNASEIAISTEELTMAFGLRRFADVNEADGEVKIVMSLIQAKRLLGSLAGLIQNYESAFGEINTTPTPRVQPSELGKMGFKS